MRRPSVLLLLCLLPTLLRGQTSGTAPTFHAGQWAAEFYLGGFSGIGALHFSTPSKAWMLSAQVSGQLTDWSGSSSSGDNQNVSLNVGRRWYRPGMGRVRPFTGLGVSGNFWRWHSRNGTTEQSSHAYGGGLFGQVGAAVFFAPELSLGASWGARLNVMHQVGTLSNDVTNFEFNAGYLSLQGAFYF